MENIITATFDKFNKTMTAPAWLVDYGMQLKITGIDLPATFECHFSNSRSTAAKQQIGQNGVVTIPDEYFATNEPQIFCWIYLHPTEDSGTTKYEIVIPLLKRPEIDPATPTPEQQDVIEQAIALLEQNAGSLGDGGIKSVEYVELYNFTATTATDETHDHPYANTGITGRIDKRYAYRVTVDGTEYVLPCQLLCYEYGAPQVNLKVIEYLGNVSLYRLPMDGLFNVLQDVPFLIVSDSEGAGTEKIRLYTEEAGEHTVLVEKIVLDSVEIPATLIFGDEYRPFMSTHQSSTYEAVSFGCNKLANGARYGFAFGYGNIIGYDGAFVLGILNEVSAHNAAAFGRKNLASGVYSLAIGRETKASGNSSLSAGYLTVAAGAYSHAEGLSGIAGEIYSHAEGEGGRAMARGSHVEGGGNHAPSSQAFTHIGGVNNATTNETGKTVSITRYNEDGTVAGTADRTLGKYAEVIGNGDSDQSRSNARTLDWDGNEELAGSITLGKGTANEVTLTAAQLKALLALL